MIEVTKLLTACPTAPLLALALASAAQAAGNPFALPGNAGVAVPPGNASVAAQPGNVGVVPVPGGIGSAGSTPNLITPYAAAPPAVVTPLEQEKAVEYRMRLRTEERRLELLESQGALDAEGRRRLARTRAEFARINDLLKP
ncbi:MAG TPA: hypothetical protein VKY65_04585 [Alphaproteobacteria bacterium]|nr:hypothetical protein [Alphaproteobacteria bacterium]